MSDIREFLESPLYQGSDEKIARTFNTGNWGVSTITASSITVKLFQLPNLTDVSASKLSGTASVSGSDITTPQVISLEAGIEYRLEVKFEDSDNGNIFEAWGAIIGET